jgi:hypothetical protein
MKKCLIALFLIVCMALLYVPALFADSSDVVIDETVIEPKDPILATVLAVGPGIFIHGWGQFYSENYRMGFAEFGSEAISLTLIGAGIYQYSIASKLTTIGGNQDTVQRGAQVAVVSGVGLFIVGYLVDIVLAGKAAEQYNTEHHLEFKVDQESYAPSLMYTYNF